MKIYAKNYKIAVHIDDAINDLIGAMSSGERFEQELDNVINAADMIFAASEGKGPTSEDFYTYVSSLAEHAREMKRLIDMIHSEISQHHNRE